MEPYLAITHINDFLFCPRSLYYSGIFRNTTSTDVYHQMPQREGQAVHRTLDEGTYSTRADVLTGMPVWCERYGLYGVIDQLDLRTGRLTERKNHVSAVWPGFKSQLYAQYYALAEMGYDVRELALHSIKDNRTWPIALPGEREQAWFEHVLDEMKAFRMEAPFVPNPNKCVHCIYSTLCDMAEREP